MALKGDLNVTEENLNGIENSESGIENHKNGIEICKSGIENVTDEIGDTKHSDDVSTGLMKMDDINIVPKMSPIMSPIMFDI